MGGKEILVAVLKDTVEKEKEEEGRSWWRMTLKRERERYTKTKELADKQWNDDDVLLVKIKIKLYITIDPETFLFK